MGLDKDAYQDAVVDSGMIPESSIRISVSTQADQDYASKRSHETGDSGKPDTVLCGPLKRPETGLPVACAFIHCVMTRPTMSDMEGMGPGAAGS